MLNDTDNSFRLSMYRSAYEQIYKQNCELVRKLDDLRGQKKKDDLAVVALSSQLEVERCYRNDYQAIAEQRRVRINELEIEVLKLKQLAANAKQPPAAEAPAPASTYRELLEGEVIQPGDEFSTGGDIWYPFELGLYTPYQGKQKTLLKTRTKRPKQGTLYQCGDQYFTATTFTATGTTKNSAF